MKVIVPAIPCIDYKVGPIWIPERDIPWLSKLQIFLILLGDIFVMNLPLFSGT